MCPFLLIILFQDIFSLAKFFVVSCVECWQALTAFFLSGGVRDHGGGFCPSHRWVYFALFPPTGEYTLLLSLPQVSPLCSFSSHRWVYFAFVSTTGESTLLFSLPQVSLLCFFPSQRWVYLAFFPPTSESTLLFPSHMRVYFAFLLPIRRVYYAFCLVRYLLASLLCYLFSLRFNLLCFFSWRIVSLLFLFLLLVSLFCFFVSNTGEFTFFVVLPNSESTLLFILPTVEFTLPFVLYWWVYFVFAFIPTDESTFHLSDPYPTLILRSKQKLFFRRFFLQILGSKTY